MSQIEAITHMKKTVLTPFYVEKPRPSLGVGALCEKVYPVNWDLPHDLIFLPDELDKLANKPLCRLCMLEATIFLE